VKKGSSDKPPDQALLISVAESIGSTLGAIAAKADAAKALLSRDVAGEGNRQGKKLARKNKRAAGNPKLPTSVRKTRGTKRTTRSRTRAKR
jgi:hypothetical protein